MSYLDTWCSLYSELIDRHRITGIGRFSRRAFAAQLEVPGLVAFRAVDEDGATVGMVLWYVQGPVGYYHLAAYSPRGYEEKASYALFWAGAERLRGRLRWLSLGAGAGATCDGSDGLTRFKKGWTRLVGRSISAGTSLARSVSRISRNTRRPVSFPHTDLPSDCRLKGCNHDRDRPHRQIVAHYEGCLASTGTTIAVSTGRGPKTPSSAMQ